MVVQETGRKKQQKIRFANMGGKILLRGTTWSCRNKCSLYKRVEGQVEKVDEGRQGGGEKKDLTDVIPRCLWAVDCGAKFSRAVLVHVLAPQHLRMSSRRHDKTTRDTTPLCFFRQVFPKLWGFPEPCTATLPCPGSLTPSTWTTLARGFCVSISSSITIFPA